MAEDFEIQFARATSGVVNQVYKLVPNPDAVAHDYTEGAQLHWEEAPDWRPRGHFFVPSADLRAIGEMFIYAADIADAAKAGRMR